MFWRTSLRSIDAAWYEKGIDNDVVHASLGFGPALLSPAKGPTVSAVLATHELSKSYGGKAAVKQLSLTVNAGQVFGLLGLNGSGKTTTLAMLLGAVVPDLGSVRWFGQAASARQRLRIGALLEQPSFYPWLSGEANLGVIAAIKRVSSVGVQRALQQVGLWAVRDQAFQGYSLGMKQRLGLASALLGNPEVLVLDEPTNGVDAQGIYDIRAIIGEFAGRGGTVILSSHIMDEVEKVCDYVAILKAGSLHHAGATKSVLAPGGWIELAAADLAALERALHELDAQATVERSGDLLLLRHSSLSPGELNHRLMAAGIFLHHLVQRQPSLESQYLALMGNGVKT